MLSTTPYRNPPYRMPSFKSDASIGDTANDNGSPKRKRSVAQKSGFVFQSDLSIRTTPPPVIRADEQCDSPRSTVAQHLSELDIRKADPIRESSEAAGLPRKRMKRQKCAVHDEAMDDTPVKTGVAFVVPEIAETPDCRTGATRSPTPSPTSKQTSNSSTASSINKPGSPVKRSPKRMRSPPPPSPSALPLLPPGSPSPPQNPSQNSSSQDSISPTTLTWQDSEITGHDIYPTSPDDDGEGINGVGFRPTPAMAAARSQRRKQQVSEWRAREAKEARQRRFQKRQGCSDEVEGEEGGMKRGVRFAGLG